MFMIGGLHSIPMLTDKPQIINYELNEWLRFDKVGKYRLYIFSQRVTFGERYSEESKPAFAISNIVEFEIVPANEKWQQETLANAVKILDSSTSEKEHEKACLTLRYLGTKETAKEIINRFTGDDKTCNFDFYMGLQGSPKREFIVEEMQKIMEKPEFPVIGSFLQDLSLLSYFLQTPRSLSKYPGDDKEAVKKWEAEREAQEKSKHAEYKKYTDQLARAIKRKQGRILAISLDTLLDNIDDKEKANVAVSLAKVFLDLPTERQKFLLEYRWEEIKSSQIGGILQKIYENCESESQKNNQSELRDLALKRLYELEPQKGRELILTEVSRPKLRVGNDILTILTDKELPEIEDLWLTKAINNSNDFRVRESYLLMLERYGTTKPLSRLKDFFENKIGQMECVAQENLINYFLKHDANFGAKMVKKAMIERAKTKCYNSVFESISKEYWSKEIEQLAVMSLSDENIGVVKEVIETLGKYGSKEVKDKIWQRFVEFSIKMKADASALKKTFGDYSYPLQTIELSFIRALTHSPNWKLSQEEKSKIVALCISKDCLNEIDHPTVEVRSK
ncbi:MAG: hypothetical protein K1X72_20110 [Pyrinomonadaceae bacterium]|nr:hypothetical protein [Pyrinomonadaceae bacterium]